MGYFKMGVFFLFLSVCSVKGCAEFEERQQRRKAAWPTAQKTAIAAMDSCRILGVATSISSSTRNFYFDCRGAGLYDVTIFLHNPSVVGNIIPTYRDEMYYAEYYGRG